MTLRQDLDAIAAALVKRVMGSDNVPLEDLRETFKVLRDYYALHVREKLKTPSGGQTFADFAGATEEATNGRAAKVPDRRGA
jgi:hypothetical protein